MAKKKLTPDEKILSIVQKRNLKPNELEKLLKTVENYPQKAVNTWSDYFGYHAVFGIISDTHIGHEEFDECLARNVAKQFKYRGVEVVYHCGDILEGMSGREGHIYELEYVGISEQLKHAAEMLGDYNKPIYFILGNHDLWAMKKSNQGMNVGDYLEDKIDNMKYIGDDRSVGGELNGD